MYHFSVNKLWISIAAPNKRRCCTMSLLLHLSIVFLFLLITVSSVPLTEIHRTMTIDELRHVFHVEHPDHVPEYDVVELDNVKSKRSTDHDRDVHLTAFGKPYHLRLKRNNHLLPYGDVPVWLADSHSSNSTTGNYTLQKLNEELEDLGHVYQDISNEAALLLHKDQYDGALLMHGTLGHDLVIRPAPSTLRRSSAQNMSTTTSSTTTTTTTTTTSTTTTTTSTSTTTTKRPFVGNDDEAFLDDEGPLVNEEVAAEGFPLPPAKTALHFVFRRNTVQERNGDYDFMETDRLPTTPKRRRKREAPYVIYPEILAIVDYDGYRLHGGDNLAVKRYFVSFWNGVDLRYRLLKGPRVRISIAGIIISRGRDATPYLERNRVGRDAIDSASALTDLGKYLFLERRLPVYDIAVIVTKLDMCRRQQANDICNRGTAGFAYVGGACVVNKRLEKVNSVAIVEDTGGFSGIIVAAHEVGHLLGAVHDGSPAPSYLGGPGATKCRWEDGYIMSDLRHTDRGFQWSPCTIAQFHHFLNGDTATCLYNSPHEESPLPRVLPGKLLSLDAQCRRDRGTSACFKDDRVCAQLFCFDAASGYCVAYRPAAEGSPCGEGHHCLSGRCVPEHENAIPDFSHLVPSVYGLGDGKDSGSSNLVFADANTSPIQLVPPPDLHNHRP